MPRPRYMGAGFECGYGRWLLREAGVAGNPARAAPGGAEIRGREQSALPTEFFAGAEPSHIANHTRLPWSEPAATDTRSGTTSAL